MKSQLVDHLKCKYQPIAIILTDHKPTEGLHFKEKTMNGCVGAMMTTVSKRGRTAYFNRQTYGCPGGGTGLGFGNRYEKFPIDCLLSTGNKEFAAYMGSNADVMAEGERFFANPEIVQKWLSEVPFYDVPTEYVVFKPLAQVSEEEKPELVIFFANADQLSALITLTGYDRGTIESVSVPFGAACQSILYGYAEAKKETPRGIIGYFDIAQRRLIDKNTLSYTVPYKLFKTMEGHVQDSFLLTHAWQEIEARQE